MLDEHTLSKCRENKEIRKIKISSLEHAISESEKMISESNMNEESLTFLRRKVAESKQALELLYLME